MPHSISRACLHCPMLNLVLLSLYMCRTQYIPFLNLVAHMLHNAIPQPENKSGLCIQLEYQSSIRFFNEPSVKLQYPPCFSHEPCVKASLPMRNTKREYILIFNFYPILVATIPKVYSNNNMAFTSSRRLVFSPHFLIWPSRLKVNSEPREKGIWKGWKCYQLAYSL